MFRLLVLCCLLLTGCCQKKKEPFDAKWLAKPLEQKETFSQEDMSELLQQPFFFLGQGAQCYAFLGEDGKTVLKLFKKDRFRPFWKKKKQSFNEACAAYTLAFKQLREETALFYLHLEQSPTFTGKLTLIDEQKKVHLVSASETAFLLQKRVELLPDYLDALMKNGDRQGVENAIQALEHFFIQRTKKGITDPKQALRINYGFVENQVVQLDPGKIYEDPTLVENPDAEIKRLIDHLHVWMSRKNFTQ